MLFTGLRYFIVDISTNQQLHGVYCTQITIKNDDITRITVTYSDNQNTLHGIITGFETCDKTTTIYMLPVDNQDVT